MYLVDSWMIAISWIICNQLPCEMDYPVITPNDRGIYSVGMMMMLRQVLECPLLQVLAVLSSFHTKSGKRFFDYAFKESKSVHPCSSYHGNLFCI